MPELPEVESVLRAVRDGVPSLTGREIRDVDVLWSGVIADMTVEEFGARLRGRSFSTLGRHGKYLIFSLVRPYNPSDEIFLVLHLRMTGRLFVVPHEQETARHTRCHMTLDDGHALRFDDPRKFGRIWLVDNPAAIISKLGPDALTVDFETFEKRLLRYRRQIKPLLLDQSFVAGIGNIYADESLFRAGIHPQTVSHELLFDERQKLHRAVHDVLEEAVTLRGANIDGVFKEGGFIVSVYGRTGKQCPRCGTAVIKNRVGERGTHFCPVCQPQHR